jgi:16S rRNA (cytosine1402-N4)-methyltransferase
MKIGLRDGIYVEMSDGPIVAGPEERRMNPRSSSAKLRWVVRAGF